MIHCGSCYKEIASRARKGCGLNNHSCSHLFTRLSLTVTTLPPFSSSETDPKKGKGGGESGGLRFLPRLNSPPEGGLITTLPLAVEGESEEGDGDRLRDGATHAFSAALLPGGSSFKLDATSAAAAALPDPGSCWRFICPSSSIVAGRLNAGGNPSPIPVGMHHSTPSPPQRSWREATETSARNFQLEDASDICESQPSSSSSIGPDRVAVRRLWRRSGFT
ncbi:hypothetical protein BHM03_00030998 [Ensete ventricosum]|nr:hypothetical protein BHM03_00030998 [Ensete ventricosum]